MRSPRDALVVIYLGFFIVATAFLFDQGIPLALYQGFCTLILVAALVGLQQSPARNDPAAALRQAGVMVLQGAAVDAGAVSVLSPTGTAVVGQCARQQRPHRPVRGGMAPADIANLAQSPELAFRVEFDGQVPPASTLYWRAMTLSRFDGRTWSYDQRLEQRTAPPLNTAGAALVYQVVAEPSGRNWLYSLSGSVSSTPQVNRLADDTLRALRPLSGYLRLYGHGL